jgi:hypothetical protein
MTTRPGYVWDATASVWVEIGQAAVISPFKYQTSQPSSPATGDIWIDSDEDVPSVDSTLYYRWTKTMSGGETSLSGTDNNSLALKYTPGYESVFINGVLQVRGSDYVATTGTTVTGLIALTANDVVMVESIIAYSVGDTYTQSTLDGKFSPITTTGLVLITSATFTAASTVNVNSCFSSTYENYRITASFSNLNSSTNTIRLRTGTTDNSTGSYGYRHWTVADVSQAATVGNSATSFLGVSANTYGGFTFDVNSPQLAQRTNISILGTAMASATSGVLNVGAGIFNADTVFDGFSLLGTANMTGTIKVYGYK